MVDVLVVCAVIGYMGIREVGVKSRVTLLALIKLFNSEGDVACVVVWLLAVAMTSKVSLCLK